MCLTTPSSFGREWKIIISEEHFFLSYFKILYKCLAVKRENIKRIEGLRDFSSERRGLLLF
jgi:hypothetical protein